MKLARLVVILLFAMLTLQTAYAAEPTLDEKVRYLLSGNRVGSNEAWPADLTVESLGTMPPAAEKRIREIMSRELKKTYPILLRKYAAVFKKYYSKRELDDLYRKAISNKNMTIEPPRRSGLDRKLFSAWQEYTAIADERIIKAMNTDPQLQRILGGQRFRIGMSLNSR
jgi:hypothetical protein